MNIISKLKYGIKRLWEDFNGIEDYWHPHMQARDNTKKEYEYYIDISIKGNYPYEKRNGIPFVIMNNTPVEFSITIFNYGLGLIDLNDPKNNQDIKLILDWAISNQSENGGWLNNFDWNFFNLKKGWGSAMGQGLGISFIYRCYILGLLEKEKALFIIKKAKTYMLETPALVHINKDIEILQEFENTNKDVLNGYIFAIWGLLDYGHLTNDYTLYNKYVNNLKHIISEYSCYNYWSYYSLKKDFSSIFYHKLHIEQLKSIKHQLNDNYFETIIHDWQLGLRYRLFFITLKAIQKFFNFKSLTTLDK